jgi:CheY-like chemotaxis protein
MNKPDQLSQLLGEGDVLITISNNNLVVLPTTALPFVPDKLSDVGDEAPLGTFHAADNLLKQGDPLGALIALRPFLGMSNPLIVTGALIREARALDRSGQLKQALSAYDLVIGSGARGVAVDNAPADVVAAVERVELLAKIANDGEDALRQLAGERWDLVVLDVMMPLRDGFEVCRQARRNGRHQTISTQLGANGAGGFRDTV